jgi:hypothetical protein
MQADSLTQRRQIARRNAIHHTLRGRFQERLAKRPKASLAERRRFGRCTSQGNSTILPVLDEPIEEEGDAVTLALAAKESVPDVFPVIGGMDLIPPYPGQPCPLPSESICIGNTYPVQ